MPRIGRQVERPQPPDLEDTAGDALPSAQPRLPAARVRHRLSATFIRDASVFAPGTARCPSAVVVRASSYRHSSESPTLREVSRGRRRSSRTETSMAPARFDACRTAFSHGASRLTGGYCPQPPSQTAAERMATRLPSPANGPTSSRKAPARKGRRNLAFSWTVSDDTPLAA